MERGRETQRQPAGAGRLPARTGRASVLPASLPPRGLNRVQAAEYVGVSPSHFDALVRQRVMPGPKRLARRVVWDLTQLDSAFDALPDEGEQDSGDRGDRYARSPRA
jgi:predicted DNA-binding transcriptional regulator AlpA